MEQILAFGGTPIDSAPFVHVLILTLGDALIEVVIELPHHTFDIFSAHLRGQLLQY